MAVNKFNDFNKALEALKKNARRASISAAKQASKKIAKDMHKEALNGLAIYYKNYDPDVYDRTYSLENAIIPTYEDLSNGKKIIVEIGIRYDAGQLIGAYSSNSRRHQSGGAWVSRDSDSFDWESGNNGTPDADWILNNFLLGIHPRTTTGFAYAPVQDSISQNDIMTNFIDNKVETLMNKYMNEALLREFTRRML